MIDRYGKITSASSTAMRYILLIATTMRIAIVFAFRTYRSPNLWEAGPLAANLANGLGYVDQFKAYSPRPAIYMPPGYAYFVSAFYRMFGFSTAAYIAIQLVQIVLGVLVVWLVYRLAEMLIPSRCAPVAGLLAALYPPLIYLPVEFHAINLYLPLEMACIYFLVRYCRDRKDKHIGLSAVCMGLLCLFRAEAVVLVLLFAALLIVILGRSAVRAAAGFALLSFLILAPWTIRNYLYFHTLIPVCESGGVNLWIGNNPLATGDDRYQAADDVRSALTNDLQTYSADQLHLAQIPASIQTEFSRIPFDQNSLIVKDRILNRFAIRYILSNPVRFLHLAMKKSVYFLFVDFHHEKGRKPAYWVPACLLSLLAFAGLILGQRHLDKIFYLVGVPALFSLLLGATVFVIPRYRIVNDPLIILCASLLVAHNLRSFKARSTS